MMKSVSALICLVLLAASVAFGAVMIFKGDPVPVGPDDFGIHPMPDEMYTENWGFLSAHDDGSYGFVNFVVSNAGFGDQKPSVDLTYWTPQGDVVTSAKLYKGDVFKGAKDALSLSVGKCVVETADGRIRINAVGDGVSASLSFTPTAKPWQHNSGRVILGKPSDFWHWVVLSPRAKVTGAFVTQGMKHDVSGSAYLDHTWSNQAFFNFSKKWLSLRIHGPEYSMNFVEFEGTGPLAGRIVRSLYIADEKGVVYFTSDVKIEKTKIEQGKNGRTFPLTYRIVTSKCTLNVSVEKNVQQVDMLSQMGAVERAVIKKFVTNPYVYRFLTAYEATVEISGETKRFSGKAASEMLFL